MSAPAEDREHQGGCSIREPMSPERRLLLFGIPAALAFLPTGSAIAKPVENYRDFRSPYLPPLRHTSSRYLARHGTIHPTGDEAALAARILARAPTSSPLAVMLYFEALTQVNKDHEAYNAGWRTRWNPVIVEFFRQTATTPSGDVTPWCAAFLNWSLANAGYRGGTDSASSGSFRCVPGETKRPQPGDVVVFGATDPKQFELGIGHVGIFLSQTQDKVMVLGGNQKNAFGHQAICRKWLNKRDEVRELHSFHAIRALRKAA